MGALGRLVTHTELPEPDPARESLEEAIALGQPPQCISGARRQQPEIAGILGDGRLGFPVDHPVEHPHGETAQPRFVGAVRLGGEDHIVAAVEPMTDQRRNQAGRMLTVAIHEQHGAEPRMIEARHQRRLLAEVARQRHDLDVQRLGRQGLRHGQAVVAAAVIDIDHFGRKTARLAELPRDLDQAIVKPRQADALVVHRHDDRQAGRGLLRPGAMDWSLGWGLVRCQGHNSSWSAWS